MCKRQSSRENNGWTFSIKKIICEYVGGKKAKLLLLMFAKSKRSDGPHMSVI